SHREVYAFIFVPYGQRAGFDTSDSSLIPFFGVPMAIASPCALCVCPHIRFRQRTDNGKPSESVYRVKVVFKRTTDRTKEKPADTIRGSLLHTIQKNLGTLPHVTTMWKGLEVRFSKRFRAQAERATLAAAGTAKLVWWIQRPASGAPCQRCIEIDNTCS